MNVTRPSWRVAFSVLIFAYAGLGAERHSVTPADHGGPLINPGMGWTLHFYSNFSASRAATHSLRKTAEVNPMSASSLQ